MYEYKTEKVDPSSQQNVINAYALFGWELVSSNETYHESTEITGVHTDVRSYGEFMQGFTGKDGVATTQYDTVTHVTNFVTLQFRRETTMPHYAQLTALEQEFEATNYPRFTKKAPSRTAAVVPTVVAAIAFAILAISLIQALVVPVEIESSDYIIIAILCAVIVIAVLAAVVLFRRYKRDKKEYAQAQENYQEECRQVEEKLQQIYQQARALLDS